MNEIVRRVRFWVRKKPFIYKGGTGFAVESYNPFTDKIWVRLSRFGYVTGHRTMSRSEFVKISQERGETDGV